MISPLLSLMMDRVCSLQAHGVCAAIRNSGNTWMSWLPRGTSPKASLDFSSLLLGLSLAIADGNRSFLSILSYISDSGMAVTVLYCVYKLMCPHTLSARPHTLTMNDYIIVRYFTAYNTENKRYLSRMRTQ